MLFVLSRALSICAPPSALSPQRSTSPYIHLNTPVHGELRELVRDASRDLQVINAPNALDSTR
jgi:hypothetical protein